MKLKLSAPWTTLYREFQAMFGKDKEINILFDEDNFNIVLYVDNIKKAEALNKILPLKKTFGNVEVGIIVKPANTNMDLKQVFVEEFISAETFKIAFENNPAFVYATTYTGILANPLTFVVFAKEVVQFYNDNIGDLYGLTSTLYQEIAKDIFEVKGVYFNTENTDTNKLANKLQYDINETAE